MYWYTFLYFIIQFNKSKKKKIEKSPKNHIIMLGINV